MLAVGTSAIETVHWSLHVAYSCLIRFMDLFFFGIGSGSTNSVAAGYHAPSRLREFSARLGALSPCPHPHPHTLGFEVLTYQALSDSN